jgi:hypothetical protein
LSSRYSLEVCNVCLICQIVFSQMAIVNVNLSELA